MLHKAHHSAYHYDVAADPIRPEVSLSLPEQQAILLFAQRSHTLTPARLDELARMTGSLVAQQDKPAQALQGIARWLTGGAKA